MKDETIKKMKEHENYTLLLDEATDESNRSELSLIAHVVVSGEVHNLFLSLLELRRCDAESILKTAEAFLIRENLDITNLRFSCMDGCSTMARIYHGVRPYFEQYSGHLFTSTAAIIGLHFVLHISSRNMTDLLSLTACF